MAWPAPCLPKHHDEIQSDGSVCRIRPPPKRREHNSLIHFLLIHFLLVYGVDTCRSTRGPRATVYSPFLGGGRGPSRNPPWAYPTGRRPKGPKGPGSRRPGREPKGQIDAGKRASSRSCSSLKVSPGGGGTRRCRVRWRGARGTGGPVGRIFASSACGGGTWKWAEEKTRCSSRRDRTRKPLVMSSPCRGLLKRTFFFVG